jgi:hypothetical protein
MKITTTVIQEVRFPVKFEYSRRTFAIELQAHHAENTQAIIDHCVTILSDQAVARLPEFKHIEPNIKHVTCIKDDLPRIPHERTCAQIPGKLMLTKRDFTFLQFGSGAGDNR